MKSTISMFITIVALLFVACQSDKKPATNQLPAPAPVQPLNAPVATAGIQHYICPNNCAGSGGAQAGTCATCGAQYAHNAAFHGQPGSTTTPSNPQQLPPASILTNPQPGDAQQPVVTTPQTQPAAQEPAQNAAGVWHYVCSKACGGTGGTRGLCPKCGAGLDHNDAYHK